MNIGYDMAVGDIVIVNNTGEQICKCDILVTLDPLNILHVEEPYTFNGWDMAILLYDKVNNRCFDLRYSDIIYLSGNQGADIILEGRTPTEEDMSRLADLLQKIREVEEETEEEIEEEEEMELSLIHI